MKHSISLLIIFVLSITCAALSGCARSYVEEQPLPPPATIAKEPIKEFNGPKTVAAVLPLGLSARAAKAYPHLLDKDVGLGIHNRVVETLYETKRFRFVEDKPEIIKNVLQQHWMSMSGMVDQASAVAMGKMLGARKVIYGEVFDFAQGGEKIGIGSVSKDFTTRMGVQIRIVDVETLEYVPGSGVGMGGDVGEASDAAIRQAVDALIRRLD